MLPPLLTHNPPPGYRARTMWVQWQRAVTESSEEAAVPEASVCCGLAVPGDKRPDGLSEGK